jgi:integrase
MSVRKRTWVTAAGKSNEAWVVDYVDQAGKRHLRTFDKKKVADAFHDTVRTEVRDGIHTADRDSITVAEAGKLWLATGDQYGLERSTIAEYRRILDRYIIPNLGHIKLSRLSAPMVQSFLKRLMAGTDGKGDRLSPSLARRIKTNLGMLLADAQENGLVARNVARGSKRRRHGTHEERGGKLKVGVDIPTPSEIRGLLEAAEGLARPFLMVAIFTGLRASELRGLRWSDVDFKKGELHVHQRADRYHKIGPPKSKAGERTVPIPPQVLGCLREWKLACPKGQLDLVFPTRIGTVESHPNIILRVLTPTMIAAGVSMIKKDRDGKIVHDDEGKPIHLPKYSGLHALRHFFASWCINRKTDGGLELPAKVVQERLGHSTIVMTLDRYGHLFPRGEDTAELAAAERVLLG